MSRVIIGCGYVGERVAAIERAAGESVSALVRREDRAAECRALGLQAIIADLDVPASFAAVPTAGAGIYYFAPPPARGTTDPRLRAFLVHAAQQGPPARVVLISTTGVYGDCAGEWVTEDRPANPQVDRARRRLDAETALLDYASASGVAVVILRVPGIYGPGKLPLERLQRGEPVLAEQDSPYSNRIHVDDLAAACVAAMQRGRPGAIYNISDGHPTTMTDFFYRVADVAGLPRPPAITLAEAAGQLSEGMRSYLAESKRLDNRRLREELGVQLRYPTLTEGLRAAVGGG